MVLISNALGVGLLVVNNTDMASIEDKEGEV
jgi:hypothetical protein